jgi:hypothetical protein
MKLNVRKVIAALSVAAAITIFMSGCVERRYYHEHHRHTVEYYHRHHMPPPPGIDIDIHN